MTPVYSLAMQVQKKPMFTIKKTNKRGFSLVELMIVITIVAILAAAGMPQYLRYLQRASVVEGVHVLSRYKLALGMFWSIDQRLPTTGDTLRGSPADLPFGTLVENTEIDPLPDTIQSLQLTQVGNGVLITAILQGNIFSTVAVNNRTLVLGAKSDGDEIRFVCGNFTPNPTAITDIGFTLPGILPSGCNYNGVETWLNT